MTTLEISPELNEKLQQIADKNSASIDAVAEAILNYYVQVREVMRQERKKAQTTTDAKEKEIKEESK